MNNTEVRELLERAAATVTPAEQHPAARLAELGRHSVRRRRVWGSAGSVAAAVLTAVIAVPVVSAVGRRPGGGQQAAGPGARYGGLTVTVPNGWQTSRVESLDRCTAKPHTVYFAERSLVSAPQQTCASDGTSWMAVVKQGAGPVDPDTLVFRNGQVLDVGRAEGRTMSYHVFSAVPVTTVYISGDKATGEQLLNGITWPDAPKAPQSGGLALPSRITSAQTRVPPDNRTVVVHDTDKAAMKDVRTDLVMSHDRVPAGEECTIRKPDSVAIALNSGITVVFGTGNCLQAVSTAGGRVRVYPASGPGLRKAIALGDFFRHHPGK